MVRVPGVNVCSWAGAHGSGAGEDEAEAAGVVAGGVDAPAAVDDLAQPAVSVARDIRARAGTTARRRMHGILPGRDPARSQGPLSSGNSSSRHSRVVRAEG